MKLYIMRHGHSPSLLEAKVASDSDRPLSAKGQADARKAVKALLAKGGKPGLILHSPLRRAVETAKAAAEAAGIPPSSVEVYEPLSNVLGGPELFAQLEKRLAGVEEALLVGHQPQIGELAAYLAEGRFSFSPAGVAGLELKGSQAARLWSYNPEDLPG